MHYSIKAADGRILQSTLPQEGGSSMPQPFVLGGKGRRMPRGWELALFSECWYFGQACQIESFCGGVAARTMKISQAAGLVVSGQANCYMTNECPALSGYSQAAQFVNHLHSEFSTPVDAERANLAAARFVEGS